jgi:outer membrane protein
MLRIKWLILPVLTVLIALPSGVAAEGQNPVLADTGVLSLDLCLEMASQNNKELGESEKKVMIAGGAVKEAEAGFWPTLNYQAKREQSDVAQYQVGPGYEKTDLVGGITATLPLYTGRMLENNLKLTRLQQEIAREDRRKAKQQLTCDVKEAYYSVWLAQQLLQVQQASLRNLEQHVIQVQGRYKSEYASRLEVLRAQVQRDTLKPKVINAQNQLALAKLRLATLIGYPQEWPYQVQYDAERLHMPDSVTLSISLTVAEACQNRSEMRQIRKKAESDRILTAMKEASYKPNVALSAGYGMVNKDLFSEDSYGAWMLTLSVGGKIYDRSVRAKIEQARNEADLTMIGEARLRDLIRLEAEQSFQNLQSAIENTRAARASIDLARETLRMTQIRMDNGMATTMDIMDAQLALDQALTGYYQGIVSYLIAEAKLDLVTGKD